jgi:para-aminobenzoate synthetase/4-amino-4-deoxychorismate lyase
MGGIPSDLKLIETILWENGDFFLPAFHAERLIESCRCFSFPCDKKAFFRRLRSLESGLPRGARKKVRLLVDRKGRMDSRVGGAPLPPEGPVPVTISARRTRRNDILLRHKTTARDLYDNELSSCRAGGFFEILFFNDHDELTEGAISNIMIEKNGDLFTPPVNCGVLPGVYRRYLLGSDTLPLSEKVLRREDLFSADRVYVMNSVMKIVEVSLPRDKDA